MMRVLISAAIMGLVLSSCSAQRQGPPRKVIDRALKTAPGKAQPSRIVATEIAFARAGREKGRLAAFREFMAPGAVIHGPNGIVDASKGLSGLKDREEVAQSGVRNVWMSCDAKMAISKGRYRDPSGIVGSYITVWERQGEDEYRWLFNTAAADDPQPTVKKEDDGSGAIIVIADEMIRGHVADCPKRGPRGEFMGRRGPEASGGPNGGPRGGSRGGSRGGPKGRPRGDQEHGPDAAPQATLPPPPGFTIIGSAQNGRQSPDGTIIWGWQDNADAAARFESYFLNEGQWRKAASF